MIFSPSDEMHTHGIRGISIVSIDTPLPSGNIYPEAEVEKAIDLLEGSPLPVLIGMPAYEFIEKVVAMQEGDNDADPFDVEAQGMMENVRIEKGELVGDLYPTSNHFEELERIIKTPFDISLFTVTEGDEFVDDKKILKNITFVCVRVLPAPH